MQHMSTRRKYSPEFKEDTIELVKRVGTTQVSKDLGIDRSTLSRWVKEQREAREGNLRAFPGQGSPRDEELHYLRKRAADLEETNEILKKAAVIFAQRNPR